MIEKVLIGRFDTLYAPVLSVRRVADELSIWKTSIYEMISDYLGMKKVSMRWVTERLTPLQRANRVDCCEELLKNCNQDLTGFFSRIPPGDETRIHYYDLLSQHKATIWKKPDEPGWPLSKSSWPSFRIVKMFFSSIFYHVILYNQWSILRITPSQLTFFHSGETTLKI